MGEVLVDARLVQRRRNAGFVGTRITSTTDAFLGSALHPPHAAAAGGSQTDGIRMREIVGKARTHMKKARH